MAGTTKKLAASALLITLDVVLTRILAINTPLMKIGLGFAPVALCALLFGPWWAGLVAALGDIVGSLLLPTGAYFPGFTLTAAGTGILFGLCLYRRGKALWPPLVAAGLNCLLISWLANTAMIAFISGAAFSGLLAARAVQLAVMLPVQALVLIWLTHSATVQKLLVQFHEPPSSRREG